MAGKSADISVAKRFTVAAGELVSMFAQKLGMKLIAAKGPIEVQAQSDAMSLLADKDVSVASVNGTVRISAKKELILECGGAFVQLKDGSITLGGPLDLFLKVITVQKQGAQSLSTVVPALPESKGAFDEAFVVHWAGTDIPVANTRYQMFFGGQADRGGRYQCVRRNVTGTESRPAGRLYQTEGGYIWWMKTTWAVTRNLI
ncbi:hypothetical protein PPGU19_074100 (plasmid) [Paraburkholderia sp. PGU19]|nr:hypothetical protein PPGU19_074100 [Paraburkholderia sp. PGU19]